MGGAALGPCLLPKGTFAPHFTRAQHFAGAAYFAAHTTRKYSQHRRVLLFISAHRYLRSALGIAAALGSRGFPCRGLQSKR
eukprot:12439534-Alexandrium_andersonii.AAC.1